MKPLALAMLAALILWVGPVRAAEAVVETTDSPTAVETSRRSEKKSDPIYIKLFGMSIGFLAVVLGCGIALLAIWTDYAKQRDAMLNFHKERMMALEKGLEPPQFPREFLSDEARAFDYATNYKPGACAPMAITPGFVWIAIGIGILIMQRFQTFKFMHGSWSAIPICIGVALIIGYILDARRRASLQKPTAAE